MPLEIRPSETATMVYYVAAQHPDLVLFLRERKSSSLRWLFEDVEEVEENIELAKGFKIRLTLKICMHNNKKSVSMIQIWNKFFNVFIFFYGRDIHHAYDHFPNHFEHAVKDDCIDNYIFLADHNQNVLAPTIQLSCDHFLKRKLSLLMIKS
jgi:hypothetical protein